MTHIFDCRIYYSMIGEHFNIYDRHTDPNLVMAKAIVNIHVNKYELIAAGDVADDELQYDTITSLSIPHDVKGGPFFASETQCIIVNGKNQILKLGGKYRLPVKMYRNLNDPFLFSIIFKDREICDEAKWISF